MTPRFSSHVNSSHFGGHCRLQTADYRLESVERTKVSLESKETTKNKLMMISLSTSSYCGDESIVPFTEISEEPSNNKIITSLSSKAAFTDKNRNCITFTSLNDDTLHVILQYIGLKSYHTFGLIDKRCNLVYEKSGFPKETFICGYAPMLMVKSTYYHHYRNFHLHVIKAILFYNRFDLLERLIRNQNNDILRSLCHESARERRLDILIQIFNTNSTTTQKTLKYIKEKNHICYYAALGGDLETLKWACHTQGFALDKYVFEAAAKSRNSEMLTYLVDQDCPCSEEVLNVVAMLGKSDPDLMKLIQAHIHYFLSKKKLGGKNRCWQSDVFKMMKDVILLYCVLLLSVFLYLFRGRCGK